MKRAQTFTRTIRGATAALLGATALASASPAPPAPIAAPATESRTAPPTRAQALAAIITEQEGLFQAVLAEARREDPSQSRAVATTLKKADAALHETKLIGLVCPTPGKVLKCTVALVNPDGQRSAGPVFYQKVAGVWTAVMGHQTATKAYAE